MRKTLRERFDAKWIAEPNSGCWLWTAVARNDGYGMIGVGAPVKMQSAHRVSWELHRGPIPVGLCVLHRCDNPPCVNPAHLFLGTHADNNRDRDEKGRTRHARGDHNGSRLHPERLRRGETQHLARLTEDNIIAIRSIARGNAVTHRAIAFSFGVHRTTVDRVLGRKTWRHVGADAVAAAG